MVKKAWTAAELRDELARYHELVAFEASVRDLFSKLEATAKTVRRLHVLPAAPLSAAVALGRVRRAIA